MRCYCVLLDLSVVDVGMKLLLQGLKMWYLYERAKGCDILLLKEVFTIWQSGILREIPVKFDIGKNRLNPFKMVVILKNNMY